MHVLARETSNYNEITVYEAGHLDGKPGKYRCMQFSDDAVQGAMDLNDPKRIVLEYPRAMIHLMEHNHSTFEHVFIIGHGIGALAGHYPGKRIKVAEIDEKVVELSRIWFHYRQNNILLGDGRQLLMKEKPQSYDYIIVDAFTKKGSPLHLTTLEFYAIAKDKLRPQGAVLVNLMGRIKNDRRIDAIHATLGETFAYTKVFALPAEESSDIRNIVMVAGDKSIGCQPRELAGFVEIRLEAGHIIRDRVSSQA